MRMFRLAQQRFGVDGLQRFVDRRKCCAFGCSSWIGFVDSQSDFAGCVLALGGATGRCDWDDFVLLVLILAVASIEWWLRKRTQLK